MDKTVDSFLQEINEIAPPKNVWKECFDEKSGFAYYWNTQTDDVTWSVPDGFKKSGDQTIKPSFKKLYIPPPSREKLILDSTPHVNKAGVKIYKLDEVNKTSCATSIKNNKSENTAKKTKYPKHLSSDSGDERIVLISSYGSESSSDEDTKVQITNGSKKKTQETSNSNSKEKNCTPDNTTRTVTSPYNSEDETDILTQIQNKAKFLKQLGGEIPESVKRLVTDTTVENTKKDLTGFSLVAGYSSDEESEQEQSPKKKLFPIVSKEKNEVVSTIFPITKSVDVSQFCETESNDKPDVPIEESMDVKAFQRKRRIGVSLLNVQKRPPPPAPESEISESERPGFGFKGGTNKEYHGFKSAGVLFTKPEETVQALENNDTTDFISSSDESLRREIDEFHTTLDEKLKFLCEGHSPALPVQVMIIQMETLYTAMKEKCLRPKYLKEWLNNTCKDLSKLEVEVAPAGWLLQWDRTHKRYYYHNQTTGENQWQYPQPDIVSVDEAMDISTTPPPPPLSDDEPPVPSMNLMLPPPPPQITEKTVTPPPPPIISGYQLKDSLNNEEPFPPGVDEPDIPLPKEAPIPSEPQIDTDALTSELNSFYSDIATLESSEPPIIAEVQLNELPTFIDNGHIEDNVPVKKKRKMKMGQGLSMKKKGVSKLVEKWQNVQRLL